MPARVYRLAEMAKVRERSQQRDAAIAKRQQEWLAARGKL
jgi:hypothetical protein